MILYRKADGTPLTAAEIKTRTVHYNRIAGVAKGQITRLNNDPFSLPTLHAGVTAQDYIRHFDRDNSLMSVKYTWSNPQTHYGYVELPTEEVVELSL